MVFQKVKNAVHRSIRRANSFFPKAEALHYDDDIIINIFPNDGEYLMEYSLGTATQRLYGFIDSGSSLIWVQCEPCVKCFETKPPSFRPFNSSTFINTTCESPESRAAGTASKIDCGSSTNQCLYRISHGDGSAVSKGNIARDTLTLLSTSGKVAFPKTVFGCARDINGSYPPETCGIVGLGRRSVSLILQMGYAYKGKFSYCLVPIDSDKSSQLSFGQNAVIYGSQTVFTPIVSTKPNDQFYYLALEGISVGGTRLEYTAGRSGNIFIDSGTPLTLLPQDLFQKLEARVAGVVNPNFRCVKYRFLSLRFERDNVRDIELPIITFHFTGADVKLYAAQILAQISENLVCLAFRANPNVGIYGSFAQTNFLVGYDLQSNRVSFTPKDCTVL